MCLKAHISPILLILWYWLFQIAFYFSKERFALSPLTILKNRESNESTYEHIWKGWIIYEFPMMQIQWKQRSIISGSPTVYLTAMFAGMLALAYLRVGIGMDLNPSHSPAQTLASSGSQTSDHDLPLPPNKTWTCKAWVMLFGVQSTLRHCCTPPPAYLHYLEVTQVLMSLSGETGKLGDRTQHCLEVVWVHCGDTHTFITSWWCQVHQDNSQNHPEVAQTSYVWAGFWD